MVPVHIVLVGAPDHVELAVSELWTKTPEDLKSKKLEIADGSTKRGAFSIEPPAHDLPPQSDRVFFDYLLSEDASDPDMADLLQRADAVLRLPGSSSNLTQALADAGRPSIPIIESPAPQIVDASRRAVARVLSSTGDEQRPNARPPEQQTALRRYLASSAVRRALRAELGDYSEMEDIDHPALQAQVLSYKQPSGIHLWITAGLSGLGGQHDFEVIAGGHDSGLALSIASQLMGAPEMAKEGTVLEVDGVEYLLRVDPLGAACEWNGVTVEAALHPNTTIDGFFFRGSPWVDDFKVPEGINTDRSSLRFIRATRREA